MIPVVVDIGDDRWEDGHPDPYCGRSYLAAVTAAGGGRPVQMVAEGPGWSARYPLVLQPLPGGRWIARTPEYGGPDIRLTGADVDDAAHGCRQAVDAALTELGVVSEVFLLSPWLPHRGDVAAAWQAREGKPICLVHTDTDGGAPSDLVAAGSDIRTEASAVRGMEARWSGLRKGRRSDIARARRELALTWGPLDGDSARRFAHRYRQAMERLGADERWRFDEEWFEALADRAHGQLRAATAEGPQGGATALFLTGGSTAAYFLASRWGDAAGAPSLALWTGIEELAAAGHHRLTLGGGATEGDDDPVLAFKRSFADEAVPVLIGARVFDAEAHDEAVATGRARPLPTGVVAA